MNWFDLRHRSAEEFQSIMGIDKGKPDILLLCNQLGVPVYWNNSTDKDSLLYMDLENQKIEIHVKEGTCFEDFRYWVAHQLGHAILHEFEEEIHYDWESKPVSLKDREAKSFASRILMPIAPLLWLKQFARGQFKEQHIPELCSIFSVSSHIARYRLMNMNWFEERK